MKYDLEKKIIQMWLWMVLGDKDQEDCRVENLQKKEKD